MKINFGDVKDDKTTLTLTVYQYTNGRAPSVLSSKTVLLEGTITVKRYTSPLEAESINSETIMVMAKWNCSQ